MSPQTAEQPSRSESPPTPPDEPKIGVSGTQVVASVLASVSAAVVASFFGVAGTIVGAAVVSVVATVGSAAYGRGLRRTRARLLQVQALRVPRPLVWPLAGGDAAATRVTDAGGGTAGAAVGDEAGAAAGPDAAVGAGGLGGAVGAGGLGGGVGAAAGPGARAAAATGIQADVERRADPARAGGSDGPPVADRWRAWWSRRRWSLAAGVAIVLVTSLATVTLVELLGSRSLSGESSAAGGTSMGQRLTGDDAGGSGGGADDAPRPSPSTDPPAAAPSPASPDAADGRSTTTGVPSATTSTAPASPSTTASPTTTTTPVSTTVPPVPTTVAPPGAPGDSAG